MNQPPMKKLFLMLLFCAITVTVFGQASTQLTKAKSSVKSYLLKSLDNPSSYKPATWGKLERVKDDTFNGYRIAHSFRARNKFNALVLQNYIFVLNTSLNVVSAGDIEEGERERKDLQRRIDELTGGN